jgi:predicted amidohydrolase
MGTTIRLAAVHAAPVYLDRDASTDKACDLIAKAGAEGATVAAFGETWLSGYPLFAITESPLMRRPESAVRYLRSAIEVPGPETDALCRAAAAAGVDVVIGVSERDPFTDGTVYCTLLFISAEGELLGRHRKLKPTSAERIAWGEGDGSTLRTYDRDYGRLSGLNCWEHQMMLPGYVLAAQGTQVHVATWPAGSKPGSLHEVLARAFASQAGCAVISVGGVYSPELFPEEMREGMFVFDGSSQIIDPFGQVVAAAGPDEGLAFADIDLDAIAVAKSLCDIAGHYARPDVFRLEVNRRPRIPVSFTDHTPGDAGGTPE